MIGSFSLFAGTGDLPFLLIVGGLAVLFLGLATKLAFRILDLWRDR